METMYVHFDQVNNRLELSAYKIEDELYENNHMRVHVDITKDQQYAIVPMQNTFRQAGVNLIEQ